MSRVFKYRVFIKVDDFTSFAGGTSTLLEKNWHSPGKFDYVTRRIMDDENFDYEMTDVTEHVVSRRGEKL